MTDKALRRYFGNLPIPAPNLLYLFTSYGRHSETRPNVLPVCFATGRRVLRFAPELAQGASSGETAQSPRRPDRDVKRDPRPGSSPNRPAAPGRGRPDRGHARASFG